MDVSVIIVSWNVQALLRACLITVARSASEASLNVETIVVDNHSNDGSAAMVASEFPTAVLIANAENLGFTRANNQGLAIARGRYALLLNPDTELQAGALSTMLRYAACNPDVAIIGPKLLFPDGSVQSSRRRFPTFFTGCIESTVLQRWLPRLGALRKYYVLDMSDDITQEVDWVVGACILVRADAIQQVGVFDERFFMYSEELDWCYRIKKAGWKVVYLPEARVVHYEAKSSEQNLLARNIYFHDSKCKFFGKHYGRGQEWLLRWIVFWHLAFLVAEDALKLVLVGRNRPMRKRRMGDVAAAARWHFRRIWGGSSR